MTGAFDHAARQNTRNTADRAGSQAVSKGLKHCNRPRPRDEGLVEAPRRAVILNLFQDTRPTVVPEPRWSKLPGGPNEA